MFLLFVLLAFSLVGATTVIMTIQPDRIVVGVDSMVQSQEEDGEHIFTRNICKIRRAGPFFFAMAGTTGEASGKVFSAESIIDSAYKPGQSFRELSEIAMPLLRDGFLRLAQNYRRQKPGYLRQLMRERPFHLQVLLFGMEGATAQVIEYEFIANWTWRRMVVDEQIGVDYPSAEGPAKRYVVLGQRDVIKSHVARTPAGSLFTPSYAEAIVQMITMEASAYPDRVGLPCVVLEVSESGARWLRREPFCFEV